MASLNTAEERELTPETSERAPAREASNVPDVPGIMAEIRKKVLAGVSSLEEKKPLKSYSADFNAGGARKAGDLVQSEELRYLNANYNFAPRLNLEGIKSHRPGIMGRLIVKAKRKFATMLWDILKDYFHAERDYQANLVRYLNDVSRYVDARDASNFWELIRKLDVDTGRALDRIDRLNDDLSSTISEGDRQIHQRLGTEVSRLQSELAGVRGELSRLTALESVVSGLEAIAARSSSREPQSVTGVSTSVSGNPTGEIDYSYLLLENRFRGSEEEIKARLEIYPPFFEGAELPVMEVGPGRGELQQLFAERQINAFGIDTDAAMVEAATAKGLDVRLGDGIACLREAPDASLGGVIAIQVVEHLPRHILEEFMRLSRRKVARGGKVIFETINPRSLLALSSNYFRDPTHVWPLHPDTLEYAMTLAGLKVEQVKYLSPVPAEAMLREIPHTFMTTPSVDGVIESINKNFRELNSLLYGYQDYCIVAKVP